MENKFDNFGLSVGTILCTRDGRRIGNAIVTGSSFKAFGMAGSSYSTTVSITYYTIETDFGNTLKLTSDEIERLFYINQPRIGQDVDKWRKAKLRLSANNL